MKNFLKNVFPLLVVNIILLPLLIMKVNSLYVIDLPYWAVFAVLMNLSFLKGKLVNVVRVLFVPLVVNFIVYMFLYFYNMLEVISFTFTDLYNLKIGDVSTTLVSNLIMILTGVLWKRKKKDSEGKKLDENINNLTKKQNKYKLKNDKSYWKNPTLIITMASAAVFILVCVFMVGRCVREHTKTFNEKHHTYQYQLKSIERNKFGEFIDCPNAKPVTKIRFAYDTECGTEIKEIYVADNDLTIKIFDNDTNRGLVSFNRIDLEQMCIELSLSNTGWGFNGTYTNVILYLNQETEDALRTNTVVIWDNENID